MRILILSHGHPRFSKGGGELAAYALYQGFNTTPGHEAFFVGRVPVNLLDAGNEVTAIAPREYLIAGQAESMGLNAGIRLDDGGDFAVLLRALRPDAIHFHHYMHLGLELIRVARRVGPKTRIILTLHEFMALCAHHGQMIKTDYQLCHRSRPRDCHLCFPDRPMNAFFLRERYIKSFFAQVDGFVAPSRFLAQRYIDWGLPAERVQVQENLIAEVSRLPPRPLSEGESRGRFAYFGQLTPYKGVDLLIEAFGRLSKSLKGVSLDIYGGGLEYFDEAFRRRIRELLDVNSRRVRWHGPYEPEELPELMAQIDWVVMGSIWWENSPLVIQEAFRFGRPVICPNLGGMAEKVAHEVSGLHFRARDPLDLAQTVRRAATEPGLWERLVSGLPQPPGSAAVVAVHLGWYGTPTVSKVNFL